MHLRWRLAVVTGAGSGLGREVALRLGRVGAGVLCADPDGAAAAETARLVRGCRVSSWAMAADPDDDADVRLLARRAHDLGGADLLVHRPRATPPDPVVAEFVAGLAQRRGRQDERGAAVLLGPGDEPVGDARVMRLLAGDDVGDGEVAAAVLRLLERGAPGAVVELRRVDGRREGGPGSP